MSKLNKLPLSSLKTRNVLYIGLTALLLCVLGAGMYIALNGQPSSKLVTQQLESSALPDGFVPVEVAGAPVPGEYLEPGWDVRRSLEAKESLSIDAPVLADMQDPSGLATGEDDNAALGNAGAKPLDEKTIARRERLARLKKRLADVRQSHEQKRGESGDAVVAPPRTAAAEEGAPVQEATTNLADGSVQKGVIGDGQTVSQLLDDYLSPAAVKELETSCQEVFPLTGIRAGHAFAVTLYEGDFKRFEYEIDREKKLVVQKTDNGFEVSEKKLAFDTYTVRLDGEISLSLFGALERIGEHGELAMRLADIFGWQIDFIRDIRVGDSFRVLVEKRMRNDKFMGYGDILAAEFVNQGQRHSGYLFHDESGLPGYYDVQGDSLRKAFLKAPLEFSRISSDFSWKRLHPILKKYRPHPGIDYAAPTGTPVRSVANGTIIERGWMGGGGNSVKIRHMNGYETLYMHLSRFARIKKGQKVEQGEIIGYVGSTGLSTGPHLDFRMKKNGNYINPRKVKNPKAASLPQGMMQAFSKRANKLQALLDDRQFAPVRDFALETYMPDVAVR